MCFKYRKVFEDAIEVVNLPYKPFKKLKNYWDFMVTFLKQSLIFKFYILQ